MQDPPDGFDRYARDGTLAWTRRGFLERVLAAVDGRLANGGAAAAAAPALPPGPARGRVAVVALPGEDGGPVAVRHYFRGGLLGRFVADVHLGAGRPFRELALYERARRAGVPTLEPLGAVARRAAGPLPLYRFDLVTRLVAGARDLGALLEDGLAASPPRRRRAVLEAAGRAVRALHDAGIAHADLNVKNLLIVVPAGDGGRGAGEGAGEGAELGEGAGVGVGVGAGDPVSALVIDLDRCQIGREGVAEGRRGQDLLRLYRSAAKLGHLIGRAVASRADLLRFALGYCGEDRAGLEALSAKARDYGARLALHRLGWPARGPRP